MSTLVVWRVVAIQFTLLAMVIHSNFATFKQQNFRIPNPYSISRTALLFTISRRIMPVYYDTYQKHFTCAVVCAKTLLASNFY